MEKSATCFVVYKAILRFVLHSTIKSRNKLGHFVVNNTRRRNFIYIYWNNGIPFSSISCCEIHRVYACPFLFIYSICFIGVSFLVLLQHCRDSRLKLFLYFIFCFRMLEWIILAGFISFLCGVILTLTVEHYMMSPTGFQRLEPVPPSAPGDTPLDIELPQVSIYSDKSCSALKSSPWFIDLYTSWRKCEKS